METVFNNLGKQLVCSGNTKLGHNVQPNSVSLISNSKLQLLNKCQKCARRSAGDRVNFSETMKSFSEFFDMEYDANNIVYNESF